MPHHHPSPGSDGPHLHSLRAQQDHTFHWRSHRSTTEEICLKRKHKSSPVSVCFHSNIIFIAGTLDMLPLFCHLLFFDMHPIKSTSHHSSLSYNPSTEDWHSLTIVLTSLLVTAFLLSFFSICLCHYIMKYIARPRPPASIPRGLPPAIISSFPTLGYSSVKDPFLVNDGLDCAVCLEDFSDDDVLRLLTGCSHVFHPECIHLWLLTHTTCPVCRCNLDGDQKPLEVGIPMMETGRRDVDARRHEESQHYRNSLKEEEVREGVDQADGREQVMVVMEQ